MSETLPTPSRGSRFAALLVAAAITVTLGAVAVTSSATPAVAACDGCLVVSAPSIGLSASAQPGLQNIIDTQRGVAVYTPLTTATVGGRGTVWLAGHRTTYGSVFNRVPSLAPGDSIVLSNDYTSYEYIVSRMLVVSAAGWQSQININDTSRSRLILQTSHADSQLRYLIEAFVDDSTPCCFQPSGPTQTDVPAAPPTTVTTVAESGAVPAPITEAPKHFKFGSIKS